MSQPGEPRMTRRRTREPEAPLKSESDTDCKPARTSRSRRTNMTPIPQEDEPRESSVEPGSAARDSEAKVSSKRPGPRTTTPKDNNPFSKPGIPVAIRHNSEIDWLKWGRRLIACVLFVVLSAALYGVNQKFRESRKGLEHCSMTVQQASRQAQTLADELDMANEKATALEREMQALRARLKEAERNARDGVLSLQACEARERDAVAKAKDSTQDAQSCNQRFGTTKQQYETCKSEMQSHNIRADACKLSLTECQKQLDGIATKWAVLEPELDRQVEQLRSCEADLKVATEMIAHGTECLRDLAACKLAQGEASQ